MRDESLITLLSTTVASLSLPHRVGLHYVYISSSCRLSALEVVAGFVTNGRHRVVVIYHPGSQPVTEQFFDDLAATLERLAGERVPLYVTGDFNVRSDRDVRHAEQLRSLFDAFGLKVVSSGQTHSRGGVRGPRSGFIDVPT